MSAFPLRRLGGARGLSLVALSAAIALAGCGGGSSSTVATGRAATRSGPTIVAAGKAVRRGATAAGGAGIAHARSKTVRSTASSATAHISPPTTKTSSPSSARPVSSPRERLLRRFAGSGNTLLGTIVVSSAEELVWQARRPPLQIFASNGFMFVNSQAPNGSIRLSQGTYRGVRVAAHASWSVELRSRP